MRLQLSAAWLLLPYLASAAHKLQAKAFLFDTETSSADINPDLRFVEPGTTRLIIAQRLGLSQFYSLGDKSSEEIEKIETFGGPKQHIFGDDAASRRSKVFVVVDGVSDEWSEISPSQEVSDAQSFYIRNAPNAAEAEALVESLRVKADHLSRGDHADYAHVEAFDDLPLHYGNRITNEAGRTIVHVKSLAYLATTYGTGSETFSQELARVQSAILSLSRSANTHTSTVLWLPPYQYLRSKRSSSEWEEEAPMVSGSAPIFSPKSSYYSPPALDVSQIASRYTSKSACEQGTSNCTHHGTCKVVGKEEHSDHVTEYYSCVCKPSVRKLEGGGTQTTYYGGAACQKVDISQPFWLLAGVTIALVTAITMGIGLLYTMGGEELPSVIGAGVSSARK